MTNCLAWIISIISLRFILFIFSTCLGFWTIFLKLKYSKNSDRKSWTAVPGSLIKTRFNFDIDKTYWKSNVLFHHSTSLLAKFCFESFDLFWFQLICNFWHVHNFIPFFNQFSMSFDWLLCFTWKNTVMLTGFERMVKYTVQVEKIWTIWYGDGSEVYGPGVRYAVRDIRYIRFQDRLLLSFEDRMFLITTVYFQNHPRNL